MKRFLALRPVRFLLEMMELYFVKNVPRSAAELAYFLILTFFPILICINAVVGQLDLNAELILTAAEGIIPSESMEIFADYIRYISVNQSSGLLLAGIVMTVFSSSAAFRSLMVIMEDIYERNSYTGLWQIVFSVLFSLLLLAIIYLSLFVLVTGNRFFGILTDFLHLNEFMRRWEGIRYLVLFSFALLFVLFVYRLAAPRGKPRPPVLTGAVLATAALVAASALFSYFISMSSRYSLVYGSLASVIILLVWLYLCGNILILGNVFNCVWYRRHAETSGKRQAFSRQSDP